MTFVILTAGIDLSVGSILAVSGMVAAAVAKGSLGNTLSLGEDEAVGYGPYAAMAASIAIGILCGYIQGYSITWLKVPPSLLRLAAFLFFVV